MSAMEEINRLKAKILNNPKRLQEEREVIKKYGTLFKPKNLARLAKEEFKSFLLLKNNKHWEGIHRSGNIICGDMGKLRKGLRILLDESRDIKDRLDILLPKNKPHFIKGLGRAVITPILLMAYPAKYGVYNSKSEEGLQRMGLLPDFRGKFFAERYVKVNEILNGLAKEAGLTLWQLDEIVGWIALGNPPIGSKQILDEMEEEKIANYVDFGLEAHLEDFLVENWDKTALGRKYAICEEDGEIIGQQYDTPVGKIDILAKSKDGKEWLVIELKKGRSSDAVVGQVLRYIGWIKKNKAKKGEHVSGLIIVGEKDDKLAYSLLTIESVKLMTYTVNFKLNSENFR